MYTAASTPAEAHAQVAGKAQPCKVRSHDPGARLVNPAPSVSEVADGAGQSNNVDSSGKRTAKAKEERHPDQVQAKLHGIESCTLLDLSQ